ncbi:GNAT family N-acetyltransferase [Neisseriaceae bacterium TC5R-5]|nr:GNAT family N-acetyltransferase [Neisseriaceae bacterium TC5R-5]
MLTIRLVQLGSDRELRGLISLLQTVVAGGASLGFWAPLSEAKAHAYWLQVFESLGPGLQLWVAEQAGEIIASVQLAPCLRENGRHRAEVQKLLVDDGHRGKGVARALLATLEVFCQQQAISLLVLDTECGSIAETVYQRLGWCRSGEIPAYVLWPNGEAAATVYYYKQL